MVDEIARNRQQSVTMQTVADSLGLSLSTVSLALRNSDLIAEATRERVQGEARGLGYVYHRAAANLRTQRRNIVGLVVPDITNPFASEAAMGVQESISPFHQIVALANTMESIENQTEILQTFVEERVAGIILIPAVGTTNQDVSLLSRTNMPTVLMNRDIPGSGFDYICTNDEAAATLAVAHAADVHHSVSMAYFGGQIDATPVQHRRKAFAAETAARKVDVSSPWNAPSLPNAEDSYDIATALARREPLPDAIICHSDSIAVGLLAALHNVGIDARGTVIIGIDGLARSAMTIPSLTSVSIDPTGIGRAAGLHVRNPVGSRSIVTTPHLIIRRSCGCEEDA